MRAVVLAAGRGRRLSPMGWKQPKCLLEINGRTLIDRTASACVRYGIDELIVVVGYRRELIEARLDSSSSLAVRTIANPVFHQTNTLYSLYLARAFLADGFMLFNADVAFDDAIIPLLCGVGRSALAIARGACGEEEVKVITSDDGLITRIGKRLPPPSCSGEFVGIGLFDSACAPRLIGLLEDMNADAANRGLFFEAAIDKLVDHHAIEAAPIAPHRAVEIDFPEDYERARELFAEPV